MAQPSLHGSESGGRGGVIREQPRKEAGSEGGTDLCRYIVGYRTSVEGSVVARLSTYRKTKQGLLSLNNRSDSQRT
jgi:hypothetical protein